MPTALRDGPYRFFFYSNENDEPPHVHVQHDSNEAKFWLEPVEPAANYGFSSKEMNRIGNLVFKHRSHLLTKWHDFFG